MEPVARHILIIDDNIDFLVVLGEFFRMKTYEVLTAHDGERGLKVFEAQRPPLVLVDVAMPGISGFEVADRIRKLEGEGRQTVVVIMTAHARSFFVSQEFEQQIDAYVQKPFSLSIMVQEIEAIRLRFVR